MKYLLEFIPQLDDDGVWRGNMKTVLMANKDDAISEEDHAAVLAYVHRISMVGSFWEEDLDEFVTYNVWYENNSGLPTTKQELQ